MTPPRAREVAWTINWRYLIGSSMTNRQVRQWNFSLDSLVGRTDHSGKHKKFDKENADEMDQRDVGQSLLTSEFLQ